MIKKYHQLSYYKIGDKMRTFYIFKISKNMTLLTEDNPYNLYKTLEEIYLLDKKSVSYGKDLLDQLIIPINKEKYNRVIYEINKDNDFYMKMGDKHTIYNRYRDESTTIIIKNSHIILQTTSINKNITNFLPSRNLFVCDFKNKDYFWLSKLVHI